jgi:hypothetical protein
MGYEARSAIHRVDCLAAAPVGRISLPRRRALRVDRDIRRHVEPVIVNLLLFSPIEAPSGAPTSQDSFRHTKNVE